MHNGSSSFLEYHMIFTCLRHQKIILVIAEKAEGETKKGKRGGEILLISL